MIKRLVSLLMCLAVVFALTSCGQKEPSQNTGEESQATEASETGTVEELTAEETAADNHDTEPEYIQAVKTAYNKIVAECAELGDDDPHISAYMTDLNGDGYRDIIYQPYWFPYVLIYYMAVSSSARLMMRLSQAVFSRAAAINPDILSIPIKVS